MSDDKILTIIGISTLIGSFYFIGYERKIFIKKLEKIETKLQDVSKNNKTGLARHFLLRLTGSIGATIGTILTKSTLKKVLINKDNNKPATYYFLKENEDEF